MSCVSKRNYGDRLLYARQGDRHDCVLTCQEWDNCLMVNVIQKCTIVIIAAFVLKVLRLVYGTVCYVWGCAHSPNTCMYRQPFERPSGGKVASELLG